MEPIEVVGVVFVRGREGEAGPAVDVVDVIDAGGGFGEGEGPVLDDGRCLQRVKFLYRVWGEQGVALVEGQGVGDVEFFAGPYDALGLGDLKMVYCEHGGGGSSVVSLYGAIVK